MTFKDPKPDQAIAGIPIGYFGPAIRGAAETHEAASRPRTLQTGEHPGVAFDLSTITRPTRASEDGLVLVGFESVGHGTHSSADKVGSLTVAIMAPGARVNIEELVTNADEVLATVDTTVAELPPRRVGIMPLFRQLPAEHGSPRPYPQTFNGGVWLQAGRRGRFVGHDETANPSDVGRFFQKLKSAEGHGDLINTHPSDVVGVGLLATQNYAVLDLLETVPAPSSLFERMLRHIAKMPPSHNLIGRFSLSLSAETK